MRDTALLDRITVDPAVCSGSPCVRDLGTRVSTVLDALCEGLTPAEIAARNPGMDETDVRACIAYASAIVHMMEQEFTARNQPPGG